MRCSPSLLIASALTFLSCGLALMACSSEQSYRVLSFFFDGVPDPNAPPPPPKEGLQALDYASLTNEQRAELLGRKVAAPKISYHQPVREKRCDECHRQEEGSSGAGFRIGIPELLLPPDKLCAKCHAPPDEPFVHGPVAMGLCSFCHLPHQSLFPHLLRREEPRELCIACHVGETFLTSVEHETYGETDCTTCHDPHAAQRPALLRAIEGERKQEVTDVGESEG